MPLQLPQGIPNLNVNIPSMADAQMKGLQLRDLMAQQQMRPVQLQIAQQQQQQLQLENQQRQIELQSQQNMMKMFQSGEMENLFDGQAHPSTPAGTAPPPGVPDVLPFDPNKLMGTMAKNGILPKDSFGFITPLLDQASKMSEIAKNRGAAAKDLFDVYAKTHETLASGLAPIAKLPPDQQALALSEWQQELFKNPPPGTDPGDIQYLAKITPDQIAHAATRLGIESQMANSYKAQAEAAAAQQKVIPSGAAVSPDTQQQIQKDIAVATNPQIQQGKVAVATAEGIARANVEAQMARGSNAAVANVPPHLVAPAVAEATKLGTDFATFSGQMANLRTQLAAAKDGDQVAAAFAPVATALGSNAFYGTHRLAPAEVQALGPSLGSVPREIDTWFAKNRHGKLADESVKEFNNLVDRLTSAKTDAYKASLGLVNQNYGANFKPVETGGGTGGSGGSGLGVSLAAARRLPQYKGMTDAQITSEIEKYGHKALP